MTPSLIRISSGSSSVMRLISVNFNLSLCSYSAIISLNISFFSLASLVRRGLLDSEMTLSCRLMGVRISDISLYLFLNGDSGSLKDVF